MPPENATQHESERLQETVNALEEKVDSLESQEVKNTPEDWSEAVKKTAEYGEQHIRQKVEELSPYLLDPEHFLAEKLKAYREEVEKIMEKLPRETKDMHIDDLISDLARTEDNLPENLEKEGRVAEARKIADKEPYLFILGFEEYSETEDAETLLKQALQKCIDEGDEVILYRRYELLHERPFFENEVERVLQKLKEESNATKLLEFITGMGSASSDFIERPDVAELLPEIFEKELFENPQTFYMLITLYEKQPWFEGALKVVFERLCAEKAIGAFDLLVQLKDQPAFFGKPYIEEHVFQLVQEVTQKDRFSALYHCDVYKNFYSEQEWEDILTKTIGALSHDDMKALARGIKILKEKLPQEILNLLIEHACVMTPAELMKTYSDFQDIPNAKKYFSEAAKNLQLLEPGTALRLLYEDGDKKLPFEDRDQYIRDTARWAVSRNPTSAVKYFQVYEHLENAQLLLESAQKRSLIAQNLGRRPFPSPEASESAFFADPALYMVEDIERNWLPSNLSDQEFAEAAAMISRNLYLARPKLYPDEKTCKAEYRRIMETRETYKNTPLFSGRNVILASHIEKWSDNTDRFGKEALIGEIQKQQGEGEELAHYEAEENTLEALKKAKEAILEKIETMGSPMTFLFDGHGGPDALYLSDGQVEGLQPASAQNIIETERTIKITVGELSAAITKRSKKIGKREVAKDILIFAACYNHTFLRSMYDHLEASGAGKPIALGESEFGQVGYSSKESPYGSSFFDQLIHEGKATTLGDVWNSPYNSDLNPSLYIPSDNIPQQVAKNESQEQQGFMA